MTKTYELPNGRGIIAEFDDNGISKITEQALDSLIQDLNYYADKVCDIDDIRAEIKAEMDDIASGCVAKYSHDEGYYSGLRWALKIIEKHTK